LPTAKDKDGHDSLYYAKTNGLTESAKLIQAALDKLPNGKYLKLIKFVA
jgi:hypothetical protein